MTERAKHTAVSASNSRWLDLLVLWGGIAFSLAFSAIIWWAGQRLASVPHLPDTGPSWYYWKLPEPTFWSQATAWGFYLLHQFTIWGLIYYAQRNRAKYTTGLHRFNIAALAANAFFISLHFIQTRVWYDGLAQDVSIWSSQASVIVLLVWVLLMENRRRGMFFGKKLPIKLEIIRFARKYHGYFFPGRRSIPSGTIPWSRPAAISLVSFTCSCCCCRAACSSPGSTPIAGGPWPRR